MQKLTSIFDEYIFSNLNLTDTNSGQIVLLILCGISLLIFILYLIAFFKLFKKAGVNGWFSLIPIYNMWILFDMADVRGWLSIIPVVNIFAYIVVLFKLPLKFSKGKVFSVFNVFFFNILVFVLAFDKSRYEVIYKKDEKKVLSGEEAVEAFTQKYMSEETTTDNTEIPVVKTEGEYYTYEDDSVKNAVDPFIDFGFKEPDKRDDLELSGNTTIPDPIVKPKPKFIVPQDDKK